LKPARRENGENAVSGACEVNDAVVLIVCVPGPETREEELDER
jgi:hypothetical protein